MATQDSAIRELAASTLLVVGALFPIVNPLGSTPIFFTLTRGLSGQARSKLARAIAVNGLVLIVVSIFIGTHILGFFGISLPVVQVGGGLVVVASGWALLRHSDEDDAAEGAKRPCDQTNYMREAFYPLTLPLTVGPGSDFGGDHGRGQSDRGCGVAMDSDHRTADRGAADRCVDLFVLPVRRPDRKRAGGDGDERCHPAFVVHPGVYRGCKLRGTG